MQKQGSLGIGQKVIVTNVKETRKDVFRMYAVITGASSGIGLEMAKILAKRGYHLVLVARRIDRLRRLQKKIEEHYGVEVLLKPYDLSNRENCFSLYHECRELEVEVLINNAGFGKVGEFEQVPLEEELEMIDINITAVHVLTKLFLQSMRKGYILNVSSIAGFQAVPIMCTYGATKSYVLNFTKAVNYELKRAKKDVHVSVLCPGPVDTEFDQIANVVNSLHRISAKQCAHIAIRGMFRKKMVIIPTVTTKLASIGSKFAPDKILLSVEYRMQRLKTGK